jgi:hypothetical protein
MGLFTQAADAAEAASGAKVVTIATLLLTLFYIWGALPRVYRTAVALKRGLVNKDWSLWQKLGDQPTPTKDD